MQAICVRRPGGAPVPLPQPGPGEVLVRVEAAGVNYIDLYERSGQYPTALPYVPGKEAAGVIARLGEGVSGWVEGARVAYGTGARAGRVLAWLASGRLRVWIGGAYPLAEAARAHRELESRASVGKLLLLPGA